MRVVALRIVDRPPDGHGHRLLALFDCEYAGLLVEGCALARTRRGGFVVWLPAVGKREERRGIRITDSSLGAEFMAVARAAYRSLGGTEAEWAPGAAAPVVCAIGLAGPSGQRDSSANAPADESAALPICPVASENVDDREIS